MLNSKKQGFQPHILSRYLSNEKNTFADDSRVEPTIAWWKNYRFFWNFFLAIFMGTPSLRLSEVLGQINMKTYLPFYN